MASNADFAQYIVDQCSGAGDITVKKMMGDYCVYCDGVIFGLVCDNNLYIKPTSQGAERGYDSRSSKAEVQTESYA